MTRTSLILLFFASFPFGGLLAQDNEARFRLVVAADLPEKVQLLMDGAALVRSGHAAGYSSRPFRSKKEAFTLKALSGKAGEAQKRIAVPVGGLKTVVVYQKVQKNAEGEITRRQLLIDEQVKGAAGGMEIISFSQRQLALVEVNGTAYRLTPGQKVAIRKLGEAEIELADDAAAGPGKGLVVKAEGEQIFFETVEAKEHLLIVLFDGADGKLRVAVADS